MLNVYLFMELLKAASPDGVMAALNSLKIENCKFANVVALSDEKLVAQLDCQNASDASVAVTKDIPGVEGIVQTNIIAVVRPKDK
jgi:hypothetical protein